MRPGTEEFAETLDTAARAFEEAFVDGAPQVLRGLGPLFDTATVFDWICTVHSHTRNATALQKIDATKRSWGLSVPAREKEATGDPGRGAELYCHGGLMLDASPYLPDLKHDDFAHWVRETRAALDAPFGMQAPGIEAASWDALERLQRLLGPTLSRTGPRSYRYNAFAGDYPRTPFGFHVDPHQECVFQVVLQGRRRALFWEGLTLSDTDALWVEDSNGRHAPAREPEHVFDLEPGDVVFWPGTHVHGFEPDGPSLALSLVIDRASPRSRDEVLRQLEVATMAGVAALPRNDERATLDAGTNATMRVRTPFALAFERFDDALLVGACGRVFEWPDRLSNDAAAALLKQLRSGRPMAVTAAVAEHTGPHFSADELLAALAMLKGLGALVEVDAG